jgi:hypothetical protein
VDWSLQGSSSWINLVTRRDRIMSGCTADPISALDVTGHDA